MPAKKKAPVKKAAAKKAPAKKAPAKKAAVKKAAAPAARKVTAAKEAMTKTQILNTISENTELSRKQVQSVLDELGVLIESHVKPRAVGNFTIPGLMKIMVTRKPATKARKGINPFTGEETVFKAKPARNVIKVRPLKKLKDMAEK
ncbi:MAG: integration host factor [Pseudomonadales bacterium]|jgi:nucleoid DNA-binding protein|nr:integration host factor [Pseudomonadales bacterium]MCK5791667.1 HU family DNA-binding protein [Ketobacter sp.]MEC8813151.1 HU family DNA-binding protein [Pseudomonadota bacterium]RLT89868.1 MAG: integration host factor [Ketobacter sp. GenoA1]TNC90038.1 MAG: integration host factor [Alcanivorax sp.]HAG97178.1 integration host factor [Gammaproteobacteria bacterium]|tara:strand:- start:218 stop:655 length:438 start_codon:yes stop_codon:yes gene_type:complete